MTSEAPLSIRQRRVLALAGPGEVPPLGDHWPKADHRVSVPRVTRDGASANPSETTTRQPVDGGAVAFAASE
jgi:hypothetical protein